VTFAKKKEAGLKVSTLTSFILNERAGYLFKIKNKKNSRDPESRFNNVLKEFIELKTLKIETFISNSVQHGNDLFFYHR